MKNGRKTFEAAEHVEQWDELEPPDMQYQDRTLKLNRQPPPRKEQLMAHGVREIRCAWCIRIKPISGAEEYLDGWICEDCLSDAKQQRTCGGRRGR